MIGGEMNNIGIIKSTKFKNNAISLVIPVEMGDNVTGYNVLSDVLKRGTRDFKTSSDIARYLQEMYGAFFDIHLNKIGNKLFIVFYVGFLDNRFTLYNEDLWDKAVYLINEVLYHPLLEKRVFKKDIVEQEMTNHRLYIESVYDDKGHYSMNRVMELGLMDSYRIPEYGTLEELDKLDEKVLHELWTELLKKEAFAYATGNITDKDEIEGKLKSIAILGNAKDTLNPKKENKRVFNLGNREIFEKMKINQGKMSLLYNTNTTIFEGDYFALVIFNSIFGGGAHSKLFNEVREKNSLAYSIYSTFDKFAGVMSIGSGVDFKNFGKVRKLIDVELGKMKNGEFSAEEMAMAKTKTISSLKSMEDSMYNTSNYLIALRVFGIDYEVSDVLKGVESVTKERVMEVAEKMEFIAAHYLDKEEDNHGNI